MFPGYLFARIPPDGWYPLLDIPGVHTVVKAGRLAAVIDTATVDDVRAFALRLGAVECAPERVPWYQPGDLVVVTGGPFQGLRAAVSRVGGRECVTVGLTLLGQAVAVTMPDWQLERLAS